MPYHLTVLLAALCAGVLSVGASAGTAVASERPLVAELVHVIQDGQNLGMLARRYHTTVDAIVSNNKLKPGQTLRVGQKLSIIESDKHREWREHYQRLHPEKQAASQVQLARTAEPSKADPTAKHMDTPGRDAKPPAAASRQEPRPFASRSSLPVRNGGPHADVLGRRASGTDKERDDIEAHTRPPKRPGYVTLVRHGESFRGTLVDRSGRTLASSSKRVDRLLRSRTTGEQHLIDRRLLRLVADVSDRFGGHAIFVVSGYRPEATNRFTRDSRHNHGAAIDFSVAGVPNAVVYAYCKRLRDVGCGYYPNSHFVHMDVRQRKTHWVDYSRPGQAPIYAHRLRRKPSRPDGAHPAASPPPAAPPAPSTNSAAPKETTAEAAPKPSPDVALPPTQPSTPPPAKAMK